MIWKFNKEVALLSQNKSNFHSLLFNYSTSPLVSSSLHSINIFSDGIPVFYCPFIKWQIDWKLHLFPVIDILFTSTHSTMHLHCWIWSTETKQDPKYQSSKGTKFLHLYVCQNIPAWQPRGNFLPLPHRWDAPDALCMPCSLSQETTTARAAAAKASWCCLAGSLWSRPKRTTPKIQRLPHHLWFLSMQILCSEANYRASYWGGGKGRGLSIHYEANRGEHLHQITKDIYSPTACIKHRSENKLTLEARKKAWNICCIRCVLYTSTRVLGHSSALCFLF